MIPQSIESRFQLDRFISAPPSRVNEREEVDSIDENWKWSDKPNFVGTSLAWDAGCHSSRRPEPEVTVPCGTIGRRPSTSVWSCTLWGLSCSFDYSQDGGLLPRLFTLTPRLLEGRFIFCDTFRHLSLSTEIPVINSRRSALWCSDFPLPPRREKATACSKFILPCLKRDLKWKIKENTVFTTETQRHWVFRSDFI